MAIITKETILANDIIQLQNKINDLETKFNVINITTSNLVDYFTPDYSKGVSILLKSSATFTVPSNGVIIFQIDGNHRNISIYVNNNYVASDYRDWNYGSTDVFELRVKKYDIVQINLSTEDNQRARFYPYRKQ